MHSFFLDNIYNRLFPDNLDILNAYEAEILLALERKIDRKRDKY